MIKKREGGNIGHARRSQAGVTLIETMVTLALSAILLALGVPGLNDLMCNVRRDGAVSDIVGDLNFARSEAIKRNRRISLCPSADGLSCGNHTRWEVGWIVFTDPNSNGAVDGGEAILRVHEAMDGDSTLRGARKRLTYQSNGFSTGFTDTLRVCDPRGTASARSAVISNQGRVRVTRGASICP